LQPSESLMSFEGQQCQGAAKILEKFQVHIHSLINSLNYATLNDYCVSVQSLTFQKIQHVMTSVDCHPMFDGGILINVIGQLKVSHQHIICA
jgi:hypothetical protein